MMLKVGSKSSLFYSYARFRMDSLIEMDKATGASQEIIQEHMKQGTSQVNYQIFKNYPEGKLTQLEPIAASNFRSEEKTEIPVWELHPTQQLSSPTPATERPADSGGETTKLGTLRKFRAAKVHWKLQGLPGLIRKPPTADSTTPSSAPVSRKPAKKKPSCLSEANTNRSPAKISSGYTNVSPPTRSAI